MVPDSLLKNSKSIFERSLSRRKFQFLYVLDMFPLLTVSCRAVLLSLMTSFALVCVREQSKANFLAPGDIL